MEKVSSLDYEIYVFPLGDLKAFLKRLERVVAPDGVLFFVAEVVVCEYSDFDFGCLVLVLVVHFLLLNFVVVVFGWL